MRSFVRALIQYDWFPYEKGILDIERGRHTGRNWPYDGRAASTSHEAAKIANKVPEARKSKEGSLSYWCQRKCSPANLILDL